MSSLWRGYVATFEIKDNQLYLKDIRIPSSFFERMKSVINRVFPNHRYIKVDWTGSLELASGKLVSYVHDGLLPSFEYYTLLKIENGILTEEKFFVGHEEYREYRRETGFDFRRDIPTFIVIERVVPRSITLGIITVVSALAIWWFAKLIKRRQLIRNGLHVATQTGNIETIQFLVSKGVNVNAQNKDGETPLDLAKEKSHTEAAEYLESIGAKSGEDLPR